ncbi:MAG: response regulator [Polyangiaceae bacterium]|nr:response regulator [Polyangiaceae bacterium]
MRSPCGSARPLDFMATNDDDLTAKVARLEEQVRQTQKLEALGQLSAGIAHNFNNMLAAIVPVLELAKQRVEADVDLFEQALQSASRAADLVKDLMFFSRRSADPHRVQEPLETVVRRATELCVRTFGQLVHVELGDLRAASEVLVDGARTEQALVNLLVNARDAVEKLESPRRTVVVSANALPEAAARAAHDDAQGEYVELRVADRGAGMDEATRQRIFEPFFTTKPVGRGTGLGLPTAWAAAKAQGGYLTCESSPSVGTTFVLTLPSRRCGAADLHESTPPAAGAVVRVLVIDDEPFVLRSTIALLEHLGYRAFGASSGEEGVRMAKAEPADVVVLDRSMPGQPASATLAELRSLYPGLPIIAFSGLAGGLRRGDGSAHQARDVGSALACDPAGAGGAAFATRGGVSPRPGRPAGRAEARQLTAHGLRASQRSRRTRS